MCDDVSETAESERNCEDVCGVSMSFRGVSGKALSQVSDAGSEIIREDCFLI